MRMYKTAGFITAGSLLIGASVIYKETQMVHKQLKSTTNVFETEKQASYIYLKVDDTADTKTHGLQKTWHWQARERTQKGLWLPWIQSRILSYDPWTLLRLARSPEKCVRSLGVRALAEQHRWNDAQYRTLAQALDSRTLVGLARSFGADERFFLPMPPLRPTDEKLNDELKRLLSSLPTEGADACTTHLCRNAMKTKPDREQNATSNVWLIEGSSSSVGEGVDGVTTSDPASLKMELTSLQALYALSRMAPQCKTMVDSRGLSALQRAYESRRDQPRVTHVVARIIANLSLHEDLRPAIISSGWVTVIAAWMRCADLALSQHATKILSHLDVDGDTTTYADGVYLCRPNYRHRTPISADVVFVHGLMGGPFKTWRQLDAVTTSPANRGTDGETDGRTDEETGEQTGSRTDGRADGQTAAVKRRPPLWTVIKQNDSEGVEEQPRTQCWPQDWLAADLPHIRVLTIEYDTRLSDWAVRYPDEPNKRTILSRGVDLLSKLREAGVGERPVVWVGHSMGGLLIKQMLLLATEDPQCSGLVESSKGIVFYSVPHKGSPLAARSRRTKYVFHPSVEVQQLKEGSALLSDLHRRFKEFVRLHDTPVISFCEGRKCQLPFNIRIMLVPPASSDAEIGVHYVMTELSHLTICKPGSRQARLYQLTRNFISDCLPATTADSR